MLPSKVKSSFNLSFDGPLHTLKTSTRSCLFFSLRVSKSFKKFKQRNLSFASHNRLPRCTPCEKKTETGRSTSCDILAIVWTPANSDCECSTPTT